MEKTLLKPTEVAEMLQVGKNRVYEMIHSQEIPSIRLGSSIRIPAKQLELWMQEKQIGDFRLAEDYEISNKESAVPDRRFAQCPCKLAEALSRIADVIERNM